MQPKTPGPPAIERSLTPSRGGGQWQRSRKPPGCPCPRWAGSRSLRPTRRRRPSRGNGSTFVAHHGQRSVRSGEVELPERGRLATSPFRMMPAADRSGARGAGRPLPAKGPPRPPYRPARPRYRSPRRRQITHSDTSLRRSLAGPNRSRFAVGAGVVAPPDPHEGGHRSTRCRWRGAARKPRSPRTQAASRSRATAPGAHGCPATVTSRALGGWRDCPSSGYQTRRFRRRCDRIGVRLRVAPADRWRRSARLGWNGSRSDRTGWYVAAWSSSSPGVIANVVPPLMGSAWTAVGPSGRSVKRCMASGAWARHARIHSPSAYVKRSAAVPSPWVPRNETAGGSGQGFMTHAPRGRRRLVIVGLLPDR